MSNQYRKVTDAQIAEAVAEGKRSKQIAIEFGITHQAVSQRLQRLGVKLPPRPKRVKMSKKYGIPMAEVRRLYAMGATSAFIRQRQNAATRGLEWSLTFAEWWGIWESSGKWEMRGRDKGGYVMGRNGDVGPYALGNVVICTHSENAQERERHSDAFEVACGKYRFVARTSVPVEVSSSND